MTLGQLKKSLSKFPPDMNDIEMCVHVARNDKAQYELLYFIGYADMTQNQVFFLGGESAIQKMIRDGKIKEPEGYNPTSDTGYVERET